MNERERHIPKKKYVCKRNKGDHVLVLIKPNKEKADYVRDEKNQYLANLMQHRTRDPKDRSWYSNGSNIYVCEKCGHVEWKYLDKNGNEKK